jgi:predicted nucleic acid-binding protein
VLAFIAGNPLNELHISAVTLAELRFGIELLGEGSARRDELGISGGMVVILPTVRH